MKVIISGAGRVGYGIAERLATGGNQVTVIDIDADLIRTITTDLDVRGYIGHGSHPDVLAKAGVADADMFIAVTHSDEVNMVACQVAHSVFKAPTKVARIRAQAYLQKQYNDLYSRANLPIDIIISPEVEIAQSVIRRLSTPGARDVVPFDDGRVLLLGVDIEDESPVVGTPVGQMTSLFPDLHAVVVGVMRDGTVFAPEQNDPLEIGDVAYIVTQASQADRLLDIMGLAEPKARQIVVIGGGNIGRYVAAQLETQRNVRVRLIEMNKEVAESAALSLRKTVVLHGNAMNADLQDEAGVADAELVLSLTNSDETNILSAVLAKSLGAESVGALINELSMQRLRDELELDMLIDPRGSTISSVLRHVRRGRILDVFELEGGGAEVIEGEVLDTSTLAGKPISFAERDGVRIGAIIRGTEVMEPEPSDIVRAGDRIVLLSESSALEEAELLFRVSMDYF